MTTGTGHWPGGAQRASPGQCLAISTYFSHLTKPYFSILFKTSFESSWEMPGHQGENLYKIGPNKFMGGVGVCGRGEKGGAFCWVCIFHNQKMHVYLIYKQEINERYKVQKFITYYNKWDIMMLNTLLQQLRDCAT